MTELLNIIQILGAVDDEVVAQPELTPKVAALLPAYGRGAAGWYQAMNKWYGAMEVARQKTLAPEPTPDADRPPARGESSASASKKAPPAKEQAPPKAPTAAAPEPPPLTDTLASLGDSPAGVDDPWSARRLLSIAVLSRVISPSDGTPGDPLGPAATDELAQALVPLTRDATPTAHLRGVSDIDRARILLKHISDADTYPNLASWSMLLQDVQQAGLVNPRVAAMEMAPCVWEVVHSPNSHGPSVAFATRHRFEGVSFGAVAAILDPAKWKTYTPPWCDMAGPQGVVDRTFGTSGSPMRYLEEVADDCGAPLYKFTTSLDFLSVDVPESQAQVLEYRRSHDQRADGGDGAVSVDEGSLVVCQVGNAVEVVTTKRVQFRALRGMPGPVAAMVAQFVWALGYSSLAELFVNKIMAATGGATVQTIHPSPGGPLAGAAPAPAPGNLATELSATMHDCRKGVRSSLGKMAAGHYGVEEYAADVVKVSHHSLRHGAALAGLWAKVLLGEQPEDGASAPPGPGPSEGS